MLAVFSRDFGPVTHTYLRPLRRGFDELRDQATFSPNFHSEELEDRFLLTFDIPGVQRDDLNIEVTGNRLLVAGERKAEGRVSRGRFGKFEQVFTLPEGIGAANVHADLKDGVLTLSIQKPTAPKATKIEIGVRSEPAAVAN